MNNLELLSDEALFAVVDACRFLEQLSMFGCAGITDRGLRMLANCTPLAEFQLSDNPIITDNGASAFFKACKVI